MVCIEKGAMEKKGQLQVRYTFDALTNWSLVKVHFGKKALDKKEFSNKKNIFRYVINYFNSCLFLIYFLHILLPNYLLTDAFTIAPFLMQTIYCVHKFVKEGIVTSQVYFWRFNKPAFGQKAFLKRYQIKRFLIKRSLVKRCLEKKIYYIKVCDILFKQLSFSKGILFYTSFYLTPF